MLVLDSSFRILKQKKAFHIEIGYYIFTAELCAILMALSYIVDLPCTFLSVLVYIYAMYVSAYMHFRVYVCRNCSRAINSCIIIKHA